MSADPVDTAPPAPAPMEPASPEEPLTQERLSAQLGWLLRQEMRALLEEPLLAQTLEQDFFAAYRSLVAMALPAVVARVKGPLDEAKVRIVVQDVVHGLIANARSKRPPGPPAP